MADTTLPGLLATGDHASRPAASAVGSGGLYSCTDHALVYQTDGSSWTTWASLTGGGIAATLIDAKGDLIVGSAADTAARLAAATGDGSSLIVASGEATGLKWLKHNHGGTVAPAVGDDNGDGYAVGSIWIDTTNDAAYICVDASTGAAVWNPFEAAGSSGDPDAVVGTNWARVPWGIIGDGGEGNTTANSPNATDGSNATSFNSSTATVPHSHIFDLSVARRVSRVEVVYSNSNNRAKAGTIDYSDDASSWTTAASFDDASTSRSHTFSAVTARYWRVRTTETGQPGIAGTNIVQIRLIYAGEDGSATDRASGLTPTSDETLSNPTNATNGYENSAATASSFQANAYLRVDLGSAQTIKGAVVKYDDTAHTTLAGKIQYSSNDSSWSDAATFQVSNNDLWRLLPVASVSARYWRLYADSKGNSNGSEYQLFQLWG